MNSKPIMITANFTCTWTLLLITLIAYVGQHAIVMQHVLFKPLCKTATNPVTHVLAEYQNLSELQCGRKCAESRDCRFWSLAADGAGGGICKLGMAVAQCSWEGGNPQAGCKTYRHASHAECPAEFIPFRHSCYLFNSTHASWNETREYCEFIGTSMVEIDDLQENQFLSRVALFISPFLKVWLGATREDPDNFTTWNSGLPIQFWSSLAPRSYEGSPSCLLLKPTTEKWRGIPCNRTRLVVCERFPI